MSRQFVSTLIGKAIKSAASLRGGGSALPGLIIEKIDPAFIKRTLSQLPEGVVIISGTNGKTTTTKIVVELLEAAGLKVFTNRTGSNFSRGVAAALLGEINLKGELDADIAVLELDEAWAVKFVQLIQPRYSLLLNVMRDQLDRFGEIDTTARLLKKIAMATTDTVVLNRDDPRIFAIAQQLHASVCYFGTTSELLTLMPIDDGLKVTTGRPAANTTTHADVLLTKIGTQKMALAINDQPVVICVQLTGVYNLLNAAAALTLARVIVGAQQTPTLLTALSRVEPAFGRGETIRVGETDIELILVKNPSGFRLALLSFGAPNSYPMIAINDNYADGRDMSWLWDVDFSKLQRVGVVSGCRAYDMALRLQYDDVEIGFITPEISTALKQFLAAPGEVKQIYCSYTAMLKIRKLLSAQAKMEHA